MDEPRQHCYGRVDLEMSVYNLVARGGYTRYTLYGEPRYITAKYRQLENTYCLDVYR